MRTTATSITAPGAEIAATTVIPLLFRVVDDRVERAAVVRDSRHRLAHLLARPDEHGRGVEVLRSRGRDVGDPADARDDAPGRAEHAVQQVHDHRKDHDEEYYVADPPEGQRGLLSATIAALRAIPGRAPRMMSNC